MIILDGKSLTVEKLVLISRSYELVDLDDRAKVDIIKCRKIVDKKIENKEIIYGVNTGIGEFSEIILDDDKLEDFQKFLIYNHSAGIGEAAPEDHVRAAIASRINVHAKGQSGCRLIITQTMIEMLNKRLTPFVCSKGSVGASGDLAPMAQIALLLLGKGRAFYKGKLYDGQKAMKLAGIKIPGLKARDGLALINGSNFLTGMSALFINDVANWIKQSEIAAAMSLEALTANLGPYNKKIHLARGFEGAVKTSENLNTLLQGSDLLTGKLKTKVQDAYSMRSTPQVIGSARDAIIFAKKQVEIELNGVCDNPIFFPDENVHLSGANFQGTPVSLPMDMIGICVTMVSVMSERRMNRLNNPALSCGLPPFLSKGAGMFSGLMLSQYTADTLIVEQKILSSPASIQSIPAAADQEDFVSMGMNTALKNFQIIDCAYGVLGIEFFAAAQALDFRSHKFGRGVKIAKDTIRKFVKFLDEDRPLYDDHNSIKELVKLCTILDKVNKKCELN